MKNRGFTIVELVISITIVSIMTLVIMNFVANRIVDNAVKNAQSSLQQQTEQALDDISREIRSSANIDDPNRWPDQNPPVTGNQYSWVSDGDTLVLAEPVINTSGNVVFEDPQNYISYKDNVIYFLSGNVLYKRSLAAPVANNRRQTTCPAPTSGCPQDDPLLAANIQSFSVSYVDANDNPVAAENARSIKVNLRVSKKIFNRTLVVDETTRAVFRNK